MNSIGSDPKKKPPVSLDMLPALTILIVEDDPDLANLLVFRLSREGYKTHHAPDAKAALEYIEHSPPPALITLDVMLPYMNGFELLVRIREHKGYENLPIIMLTSNNREEDVMRGFKGGANDYITKPFRPAEVALRVKALLAREQPP